MFGRSNPPYGAFLISFLAGAAAGAAVALLYAPMTGPRMQRRVRKSTGKMIDAFGDGIDNIQGVIRKVARA